MKQYELSSHLGNVQATVSDKPWWWQRQAQTSSGATYWVEGGYRPALQAAYDYYPFGMLMPGRWATDTVGQCIDITTTKYFPVRTRVDIKATAMRLVGGASVTTASSGKGVRLRAGASSTIWPAARRTWTRKWT